MVLLKVRTLKIYTILDFLEVILIVNFLLNKAIIPGKST